MLPEIMRDEVFLLETPRLWLRWPRPHDAAAITAMVSDAGVAKKTSHIPHPYPDGEALRHVLRSRATNEAGKTAIFAITQKGCWSVAIGMIGLHVDGAEAPRVGYYLGRPQWGRGFATEALQAVVAATFLVTPFASVTAGAMSSNPASRRAQEKNGFVYTGSAVEHFPARDEMIAVDNLVLTRERWAGMSTLSRSKSAAAPLADQRAFGAACL